MASRLHHRFSCHFMLVAAAAFSIGLGFVDAGDTLWGSVKGSRKTPSARPVPHRRGLLQLANATNATSNMTAGNGSTTVVYTATPAPFIPTSTGVPMATDSVLFTTIMNATTNASLFGGMFTTPMPVGPPCWPPCSWRGGKIPSEIAMLGLPLCQCKGPVVIPGLGVDKDGKPVRAVVRASESFMLPSADVLRTQGFRFALSNPDFLQVRVAIPPGAWPANETRNPSISVIDPPAAIVEDLNNNPSLKLGGSIVDFGPSAIAFNSPVTIVCPVNVSLSTPAGASMLVHLYESSSTWIPKPQSAGAAEDGGDDGVAGETMSFSPYAALAVSPAAPEEPVFPPAKSRACGDGCIVGAVFGTLFGVMLCCAGAYFAYGQRSFFKQSQDNELGGDAEDPGGGDTHYSRRDEKQDAGKEDKSEGEGSEAGAPEEKNRHQYPV